jgi:hypothetical protein
MTKKRLFAAGLSMFVAATMMTRAASAQSFNFNFSGAGLGGSLMLMYGATTDAKYPNAFELTGISGTFFDTNNGLNINATVNGLVPVTHSTPEATNLLAPNNFSRYTVASGLPAMSNGFTTYTNLFWPGGSSQTASDYPPHGGFLDIYGLMFDIGGGRAVNLWSNGDFGGGADYGVLVVTPQAALDGVGNGVGVTVTPEPAALWLFGSGAMVLVGVLRRRQRAGR